MGKICGYFYQNHSFYRKALQIKAKIPSAITSGNMSGRLSPNAFPVLFGGEQVDEFTLDFLGDAVICATERWLLTKECMPPEQFVAKLKRLTEKCAHSICREMTQAEQEPC